MRKIVKRLLAVRLPPGRSAFLWGPRKVGKRWCVRRQLKPDILIDLLKTDTFAEYASKPSMLRDRLRDATGLVVIDEIQKVPALLDEEPRRVGKGIEILPWRSFIDKLWVLPAWNYTLSPN